MRPVIQNSVLNQLFYVQEVETTFITAKLALLLVADEVLLVAGVAAQHSQAVLTHKVSGAGVTLLKVEPHI